MSPIVGSFHTFYWENSDTTVAVVAKGRGGYPTWQSAPASLVLGTLFGGLEPVYEATVLRVTWAWRLWRAIVRMGKEDRRTVQKVVASILDPRYVHATRAVKMTAVKPGMDGPLAWRSLAHDLKTHSRWAENSWRHLDACASADAMLRAEGSTITNPDRALFVELAYQSYGLHAVGSSHA
jgi:hypothetical protein